MRIAVLALICRLGSAQTVSSLKFDAVTIKEASSSLAGMSRRIAGGPGTSDPTLISYEEQSLEDLVFMAYRVQFYQLSTPGWMESAFYNIQAKVPPGARREDLPTMLRNLLAERFALTIHHETKQLQGFVMTAGKSGIKMKPSASGEPDTPVAVTGEKARRFSVDKEGFIILPPGKPNIMTLPGRGDAPTKLTAAMQTMDDLCGYLGRQLQQPIINRTGLTGAYDFHLKFAADSIAPGMNPQPGDGASGPVPPHSEPTPTLLQALESQLGLKIQRGKVPVDVLVIDHIDRSPTAN